jgi:hypothetical protein
MLKLIYADTSVWNCLADQKLDPSDFFAALGRQGALLVLGFNVVYEIAKLFCSDNEVKVRRGSHLFDYVKYHLDLKIPVVKENKTLLTEEALDASGQRCFDFCFVNRSDYDALVREVTNLCEARLSSGRDAFILERKALVDRTRASARDHFKSRPEIKEQLTALDEVALPEFLTTEYATRQGELIILGYLVKIFPKSAPDDLWRAAKTLAASSKYRSARALVRGTLYLNWRCAKFGSIRDDLHDDMFHVVNSAHCDVFLTTEEDQARLAGHVVDEARAVQCDRNQNILDQLMGALQPSKPSRVSAIA